MPYEEVFDPQLTSEASGSLSQCAVQSAATMLLIVWTQIVLSHEAGGDPRSGG
jgi:hypothetical protein